MHERPRAGDAVRPHGELGFRVRVAIEARGELDTSLLGGMVLPHYGAAVVGPFDLTVCLAVLPFSLVVLCNLLATQWPDRRADAAVGKETLPVRLSRARLRRLYLTAAFLAAASLVLLAESVVPLAVALASTEPPTNPLVVLKAARWWYIQPKGSTDSAFQWALEWARHHAIDTPSDVS